MANIAIVQTVGGNGTNGASSVSKSITTTTGNCILATAIHGSSQSTSSVSDGTHSFSAIGSVGTHTYRSTKLSHFILTGVTAGTYTITANFSAGTTYPTLVLSEISNAAASQSEPGNTHYYSGGGTTPTGTDALDTNSSTLANQPALLYSMMYGSGSASGGSTETFDAYATNAGSSAGFVETWNTESKRVTSTGSKSCKWSESDVNVHVLVQLVMIDESTAVKTAARHYYDHLTRVR